MPVIALSSVIHNEEMRGRVVDKLSPLEKTEILIEALPYIKKFYGKRDKKIFLNKSLLHD